MRYFLCILALLSCLGLPSCSDVAASKAAGNTGSPSIKASDYPSLQAAIDAIPKTGGTLVIDGQFEAAGQACAHVTGEFGPCIYLRSNIRIMGDGVTSKIYTTDINGDALQIIASDLITVSGVEFAGPWTPGTTGQNGVGVRIDMYAVHGGTPSTRVTVEHCQVHNFSFNGMWARNGNSQIHFLHNENYNNYWNAIEIEAQDSSVLDNDLHDNGGQGIEIYSTAQRLRVANNRAHHNQVGIKLINDPTFGTLSAISVVGNETSDNQTDGIVYQSLSPNDAPSGLITISGNTAINNLFDGISLLHAGVGMTISDNIASSNFSSDINISGGSDVVVSNNVMTALPGGQHAANAIYISPQSSRIYVLNNSTYNF